MKPVKIKVLLLPHFEIGELSGDFPGEAQLFYEEYCMESEKYILKNGREIYVNEYNGVALYVTGAGKVNNAIGLTAILCDSRFDLSEAFLFTFGCAGGAYGYCTMGDVCIVSAAVDYDLGHTADVRDMKDSGADLWFNEVMFKDESCKIYDQGLINKVYSLVKDVKLNTTQLTRKILERNYPGEKWANREPKVILGTSESGDNYWKGMYGHRKAVQMAEFYKTPHPFAVSEMEDIAIANVADKFGMLDRLISMHVSVNMDVFMDGDSPESIWGENADFCEGLDSENAETGDIFETAMHNNFKVGKVIIEAIMEGTL